MKLDMSHHYDHKSISDAKFESSSFDQNMFWSEHVKFDQNMS